MFNSKLLKPNLLRTVLRRYQSTFNAGADDSLAIASFQLREVFHQNPTIKGFKEFFPEGWRHELLYFKRPKLASADEKELSYTLSRFGGSDIRDVDGEALDKQVSVGIKRGGVAVEPDPIEREENMQKMLHEADKVLELEELEQSSMDFEKEKLAQLTHNSQSTSGPAVLEEEVLEFYTESPVPDISEKMIYNKKH